MNFKSNLSFMISAVYAFVLVAPPATHADFMPPVPSPYSFGPAGRTVQDLQEFAKPNEMFSILPNRPVAAHDKDGNRVYFTASGQMTLAVSPDGKMQFSLNHTSRNTDAEGNLTSQTETIRGTNRIEIKNEKGEITGYQTLTFGGKVAQEFDAQGNLTKTYGYNDYAKTTAWVLDELSQTKTVYDKYGRPAYDQDFEGAIIARYTYDEYNRLECKTDVYGNKSFFNNEGGLTYTADNRGQKTTEYFYKTTDQGNYVLDYTVDVAPGEYTGDKTYFENGRPVKTVSRLGGTACEYYYDGSALAYTFNNRTNETTWYDRLNGKPVCVTFNDTKTKEYLYYKSRLVGFMDYTAAKVIFYQYERQDQDVRVYDVTGVPTAADIELMYENLGLMIDPNLKNSGNFENASNVHRDSLPFALNAKKIAKAAMRLNPVIDAAGFDPLSNDSLVSSKVYYKDGKIASVVSRNPQDANGWITTVYIDEAGTGRNRTTMTLSGDQHTDATAVLELWHAIIDNNQNLSDIAVGDSTLATVARTVKSVTIDSAQTGMLSDAQIARLFGWSLDAPNTADCIRDVRTRAANAGKDGMVAATYGFDQLGAGIRIYAAAVNARTADAFVVGGILESEMLDLTTEAARLSVVSASAEKVDIASLTPSLAPVLSEQELREMLDPSTNPAEVRTVNGIMRAYSANGNCVYEVNLHTGERTIFDEINRPQAVFARDGKLLTQYVYSPKDGTLSAVKKWNTSVADYTTTFYAGWGVPGEDKTAFTVPGDQLALAASMEKIFSLISSGTSIDALPADLQPAVTALSTTMQSVFLNPINFLKLSDDQICRLFGWDITASRTATYLSELRTLARETGVEGTMRIVFSINTGGAAPHLYAAAITFNNNKQETSLDLTSDAEHDNISAPIYRSEWSGPVTASLQSAITQTGLDLVRGLTNSVTRLVKYY